MIADTLRAALSSAAPGARVLVVDDDGAVHELVSVSVFDADDVAYTGVGAPGDVVIAID